MSYNFVTLDPNDNKDNIIKKHIQVPEYEFIMVDLTEEDEKTLKELEKLSKDLELINSITQQMCSLVGVQQDNINNIQNHVTDINAITDLGNAELRQAIKHHNSYITTKILLAISLGLIGVNAGVAMIYGIKYGLITGLTSIGIIGGTSALIKK